MTNVKMVLRKLRIQDSKRIYELFSNKKVLEDLHPSNIPKKITIKTEERWIKERQKAYKQKKPNNYDVAIISERILVGCIGFFNPDYENQSVEMGYWIGEPYWQKGYATQAVKEFTDLLFKKFNFNRIIAFPFSYNAASQKVLTKAGFKLEGTREKAIKKGNKFLDDKIYALIKQK